ncbi:unnamed protein product [Didymodactylos carnosus]|uniref:Integrase catalytic domain-containing protein n=1 Tax=Didymodactylos carnosus TaxID=1234261 RepID=A0A814VNY2_9BILA|nr:unnamed protein product [Didymodactylos carnosus]CAF1379606.1 unnamed protein product [Didymodactylos carnosus]CAF3952222.1 unnamed protein product [Didymodactylos carnosus]CAF4188195.1 unnamed protein product [Didymodactylos carnosus]
MAADVSSQNGIGVILKQKVGKNEHVIVYLSQNLNKIERKWGYGTRMLGNYHHPLCWLNKHNSGNEKLYGWSLVLQEYEFDIKHESGLCHLDIWMLILSKFVVAKAVPIATASEAAKLLVEDVIFKYDHIPEQILTDQGLHFNNELMQAITNDIEINPIFSTAYHPQTNGIVERFNTTIKPQLCKLQDLNLNN